jgi:hypothetical protein
MGLKIWEGFRPDLLQPPMDHVVLRELRTRLVAFSAFEKTKFLSEPGLAHGTTLLFSTTDIVNT